MWKEAQWHDPTSRRPSPSLTEKFQSSNAAVLTEYRGLTVAQAHAGAREDQ
nr:hypothetical protein [Angustibacter aerolatus]